MSKKLLATAIACTAPDAQGPLELDIPNITFEIPEPTGEHRFDSLVRLADYLAGTLADMSPDIRFSREKFEAMLGSVFLNAQNHWFVLMSSDGERITARSGTLRNIFGNENPENAAQ